MRSEYLEQVTQDYVRTARAKGLSEWLVVRHVLRNALVPVIGSVGGALGLILAGSVLFEYTFSWPGMGRLFYEAASERDYPVVLGVTFIGVGALDRGLSAHRHRLRARRSARPGRASEGAR